MKTHNILVAYATMSGSTQEIAEFVAKTLVDNGLNVKVRPCRTVSEVQGYSAVVAGAPIYMFHLHKDMLRFFQRHQRSLVKLPVAVFAGGPYGPNVEKDAVEVRKNLNAELAKFPWLQPVSVLLVGGRFDPARLRFPYNLIPALKQAPADDARNWEEIRTWAGTLPSQLGLFNQEPETAERSLG